MISILLNKLINIYPKYEIKEEKRIFNTRRDERKFFIEWMQSNWMGSRTRTTMISMGGMVVMIVVQMR